MTDCECSDDFGPCEQHADVLVVRQGAALHSADELALLLVSDLIDCGVQLSDDDRAEYERLQKAIECDPVSGIAFFPETPGYSDAEAVVELSDRVRCLAHDLYINHDDGYVILRPHADCPLIA